MARSFNSGTGDNIQAASASSLNITTAITLVTWFQVTTLGTFYGLVSKAAAATWVSPFAVYALDILGNNNTLRGFINDGGNNSDKVNGVTAITANTWTHAAFSFDGTTLRLYLNGSLDNSVALASSINTSTFPLYIGSETATNSLSGLMADAAIWNIALSAAEISALANGARPDNIRPGSLAGYWPLTGIQSPEPDLSGNKNNGTLTGTANAASGPPVMQLTPRWPQRATEAPTPAVIPELQNFNAFVGRRVAVIGY